MSFATLGEMASRRANTNNQYSDDIHMRGPPPEYKIDRNDSLAPRWYEWRYWGKKIWLLAGLVIVIVIVIVIVVAVVVSRQNNYPNYSALNYSLAETYSGTDFFQNFDYFTGYDPTGGFVHYVDETVAAQYNLTYASTSSAVLRVDTSVTASTVPDASTGRFSVRITSKKQYGLNNLFIFDVKHTPIGCATWPALWLSDQANWPENGEIDIMEQVNVVAADANNQMTLHTSSGCTMGAKRKETGKSLSTSCVNSTNDNAGCGVNAGSSTFGPNLNSNGGGILAMELRKEGIRMWQFGRDKIPKDVSGGTPNPSAWGEATADFPNTDCDIGSHFRNQSIIANIDLCGQWAGQDSVYAASCPGHCTDYVANNATAFTEAYWEFGAFNIYKAA